MFLEWCSTQVLNIRVLPRGSGKLSALWKQLEPTKLQGWRGPSGFPTAVREPALAPLANIALLCIATWRRVLKRKVRITEEKQWCESCQQCVNNVPRCLMKAVIRGGGGGEASCRVEWFLSICKLVLSVTVSLTQHVFIKD